MDPHWLARCILVFAEDGTRVRVCPPAPDSIVSASSLMCTRGDVCVTVTIREIHDELGVCWSLGTVLHGVRRSRVAYTPWRVYQLMVMWLDDSGPLV